jgi:prevent-host-death family protein
VAGGAGFMELLGCALHPWKKVPFKNVAHSSPGATYIYSWFMSPDKSYNDVHPQNRIGIREIRQDASIILARVEEGEEFIITNRGLPVARLIPMDIDDEQLIEEAIANGEILEADGNLWELPLPTLKVKGKSATQQLIEERESYR